MLVRYLTSFAPSHQIHDVEMGDLNGPISAGGEFNKNGIVVNAVLCDCATLVQQEGANPTSKLGKELRSMAEKGKLVPVHHKAVVMAQAVDQLSAATEWHKGNTCVLADQFPPSSDAFETFKLAGGFCDTMFVIVDSKDEAMFTKPKDDKDSKAGAGKSKAGQETMKLKLEKLRDDSSVALTTVPVDLTAATTDEDLVKAIVAQIQKNTHVWSDLGKLRRHIK